MKKFLFMLFIFVSVISFGATRYVTKNGTFPYTRTKEQLDDIFMYVNSKDMPALEKYMNQLISSGNGGYLKSGLEVEVVETADFASVVKIRLVGDTIQCWTVREAIQRKWNKFIRRVLWRKFY